MPSLGSYCFKPKHGAEIAEKIIERFVDKFLNYDDEGFYLHWRRHDPRRRYRNVPEGWVEFYIDTENGNLEAFSETCYWEEELDAQDLTEHFFALLGEDFWAADDDGKPIISFYERELFEVVCALASPGTRVVSFDERMAFVHEVNPDDSQGETQHIDLLDYALTVDLKKKDDPRQLTLFGR